MMLRRAGNVALAYQELCGQVSLKKKCCVSSTRGEGKKPVSCQVHSLNGVRISFY